MAKTNRDKGIARLHSALVKTPPLDEHSTERDDLWLAVRDVVCTQGPMRARAFGSRADQEIGGPDARQIELAAAIEWLLKNEAKARSLEPRPLFDELRTVAVRGRHGSARAAREDALHGMTNVPANAGRVEFVHAEVA